jgi:hypothetical protein
MRRRAGMMSVASIVGAAALAFGCTGDIEEHVSMPLDPKAPGAASSATVQSAPAPLHFDSDIQKDLDAQSCTQAGCHGSAMGGFQLTKEATGEALTANFEAFKARASQGETSLVLVKPTGATTHGGGARFAKTDAVYARWLAWIEQGSPR